MFIYECQTCNHITEHELHFDRLDSGNVMYHDTCMGISHTLLPHTDEKQMSISKWEKIVPLTIGSD